MFILPTKLLDAREREIEGLMNVIDERNTTILPTLLYPDPCAVTANDFLDGDENYHHLPRCPVEALTTYFVALP
jgi:hypothetical protein